MKDVPRPGIDVEECLADEIARLRKEMLRAIDALAPYGGSGSGDDDAVQLAREILETAYGERARFEESIDLRCCGEPAKLLGNMSLREAGAPRTEIYYQCLKCWKKIFVADASANSVPDLAGIDSTP